MSAVRLWPDLAWPRWAAAYCVMAAILIAAGALLRSQTSPLSASEPDPSPDRLRPEAPAQPHPTDARKYARSGLADDEARQLAERVEALMQEQRPYLDSDFSLARLADLTGVRTEWLSQILNEILGCSFSQYINRYRIEAAKHRLRLTPREPNVLRIAHEVGFGSKSTFYRVFKAHTEMTPRQYWQQHGVQKSTP